jgi:hypothetical protein
MYEIPILPDRSNEAMKSQPQYDNVNSSPLLKAEASIFVAYTGDMMIAPQHLCK